MKCGAVFQTDLRGGAKWCFACKAIVNKEYRIEYRRRLKEQGENRYAAL